MSFQDYFFQFFGVSFSGIIASISYFSSFFFLPTIMHKIYLKKDYYQSLTILFYTTISHQSISIILRYSHTCCSQQYWSTSKPWACSLLQIAAVYHLEKKRCLNHWNNNVVTMEDILLNIVKEATGSKLSNLKQSAQEANGNQWFPPEFPVYNTLLIVDLLCNQNNLMRSPSHELRTVCFLPLKLALESKRSKLVSLALTGLNVS